MTKGLVFKLENLAITEFCYIRCTITLRTRRKKKAYTRVYYEI